MNVRMLIIPLCIALTGSPVFAGEKTELKTPKDKLS